MNKGILWLTLGSATLCITLVALPGSTQNTQSPQSPDEAALAQLQQKVHALEARAQQISSKLINRQELLGNMQEIQRLQISNDEDDPNVEVFVGGGGSWLGVETREVTPENAKELKLPAERGALVGKIVPESPAAKAGLKENDVITEVNGQRIEGTAQFRRIIREIPAGRTAQLMVLRDGRAQNISVTLGKLHSGLMRGPMVQSGSPGTFAFQMPEIPDVENLEGLNVLGGFAMAQPRIGIDAEDLRGALGNYFGAPNGEGVLVRNVFSGTPAEKAGLQAGDVITSIDGKPIRTVNELRQQMQSAKTEAKSFKVGLLRNKAELSLTVELPASQNKEIHQRSERITL